MASTFIRKMEKDIGSRIYLFLENDEKTSSSDLPLSLLSFQHNLPALLLELGSEVQSINSLF